MLDGPRHSHGGMPVVNPVTGRKVAEVEGGEAILSRKTVANNRAIVDQLLRASMYGNGARITPYSQIRTAYRPINYSGINKSMDRVRYFANGGIIPSSPGKIVVDETDSVLIQAINNLSGVVSNLDSTSMTLHERLGQPFKAYTVLSEINANQDILNRIKKETTMTR